MFKQVRYINEHGETIFKQSTQFKGRFHDEKGYTLYAYGKTISGRDIPFPDDLTITDIGYLTLLSRHLLVDTNIIGRRTKRGKNIPHSIKEIGELIGMKSVYRFMKRMNELNMIAKVKEGNNVHYVMNPLYFLKGKTISDELYWMFNVSLDRHLSKWIRDTYIKRRNDGL